MTKIIFFLTLSFVYLGLLQLYSPFETQIINIKNHQTLLKEIKSDPILQINPNHPYSIILTDVYREGVFVRTSFIQVKIVSPFHSAQKISYKINSPYYHYLKPYVGYELLRNIPHVNSPQNIILPPGFSFVANPILGYWVKKSGKKVWSFYRFYGHLYEDLGWDIPSESYRPSVEEYHALSDLATNNDHYITSQALSSPIVKTRERDNLIMQMPKLFGKKGRHTPYISNNSLNNESKDKWSDLLAITKNYYNNFFAPLNPPSKGISQ